MIPPLKLLNSGLRLSHHCRKRLAVIKRYFGQVWKVGWAALGFSGRIGTARMEGT